MYKKGRVRREVDGCNFQRILLWLAQEKREKGGGRGDDGRENILAARMGAQEGGFMHRLRESNSSSDYKGGKNTLMRRKSCGKPPRARESRV